MRAGMRCTQAEELFSDHLEGTLDPLLRAELENHLRDCAACRRLRGALGEVVLALRESVEVAPPDDLAERVARTSLERGPRTEPSRWTRPFARLRVGSVRLLPVPVQALAAGLAIAATALTLWLTASGGRSGTRLVERGRTATVQLLERGERLIEDVRALRVVIGTAFEGRIDKVNERVEDYRRLLARRRGERTGDVPPDAFPNRKRPGLVERNERSRAHEPIDRDA
jgi:anti-sigma factor RsiW